MPRINRNEEHSLFTLQDDGLQELEQEQDYEYESCYNILEDDPWDEPQESFDSGQHDHEDDWGSFYDPYDYIYAFAEG